MDILVTDSLLREFLDTNATPAKIAECLSLCGPSIEKITKEGKETVYHIEVTTNRVDNASAFGIAQEAVAILPQFKVPAKLIQPSLSNKTSQKDIEVKIEIDSKLCERFVAVRLTDIVVKESPEFMQSRLAAMGQRAINNVIDITNYAMLALGIPMHAFDADALGTTIIVREAKKGEKFTTLDDKEHVAAGGEVIFDNGKGEIVDLPGVMGTKNSMVTKDTKNVLLVLEHIDHHKVRSASLKHEERTNAAVLNEKNPDPNGIDTSLKFALMLFEKYANATVGSKVFNWYPTKRESNTISIHKLEIDTLLGLQLEKSEVTAILESLGFSVSWKAEKLLVKVPTARVQDVTISEDIIEEIARIYGYFKLPSVLPEGKLPEKTQDPEFDFEMRIKTLLSGWGGNEVYTLSLVSKNMIDGESLKLKNPLGGDSEYLRTSIIPSLVEAAKTNRHETTAYHLFEIAHIYIPVKKKLPKEETHLAGIFANTDYRHAKGILEALFKVLHITKFEPKLKKSGNYYVYEYPLSELLSASSQFTQYKPISLFPPQIEDVTLVLGEAKVGTVISIIKNAHEYVSSIEFLGSYENNYSFRISYLHPQKTLTDKEVTEVREGILTILKKELSVREVK